MNFDFTSFCVVAKNDEEKFAAEILCDEIELRTGKRPAELEFARENCFVFSACGEEKTDDKDFYEIFFDEEKNIITAYGIGRRAFLFAIGLFLRKTVYDGEKITLIKDITGKYSPEKRIRGHQIGYRTTPNTYDAWSPEDMKRHYLDSMFYGCNTTELIPPEYPENEKTYNRLMKYDQQEFTEKSSEYAQEVDMDISVWYPNDDFSVEETARIRKEILGSMTRLNTIFPPGSDPGKYPADELIERCTAIADAVREVKPDVEMWPSAQMPRGIPGWGDVFVNEVNNSREGVIQGVIQGPNRAMEIDELRKRISGKFDLRLYPDITHNVRSEWTVHYPLEDWHYSLAAVNGRESVNPRPAEYKRIHAQMSPYTVGSVTYSEGVTDDVNKFVWSMLEFDSSLTLSEILEDYSRLFFPSVPERMCADGIMGLEYNWYGDPVDNPSVENTHRIFTELVSSYPKLENNWRFMMCLYRAKFDLLVKTRRVFELDLIDNAKSLIRKGKIRDALRILKRDYSDEYYALHKEIEKIGDKLFDLIGMQTSVERHCADSWERGAVLDTIDRPVTNRKWLIGKIEKYAEDNRNDCILKIIDRNKVEKDECWFSFAEHGYLLLNTPQKNGEPYIDFLGDTPANENGEVPCELLKAYDHYSLNAKLGGFTAECDYNLIVSFYDNGNDGKGNFCLKVNGNVIYQGVCYGGERNREFDELYLAPDFFSVTYRIPKEYIINGCIDLEITESEKGIMAGEFRIVKRCD